jgi:hypothetical protein
MSLSRRRSRFGYVFRRIFPTSTALAALAEPGTDSHIAVTVIQHQDFHEEIEAGFRGVICRAAGESVLPGETGNIDDGIRRRALRNTPVPRREQ